MAVLRSWEDRFGATLLQLGPTGVLRVLAERPPATIEAATALAAEHWAFGEASDSVQEIAAALIATPRLVLLAALTALRRRSPSPKPSPEHAESFGQFAQLGSRP